MITLLLKKRQYVLGIGLLITTLVLLFYAGCSTNGSGEQDLNNAYDPKPGGDPSGDPSTANSGAQKGRELFDTIGCMGCHMINGNGGRVGPDLSNEADKGKSRQWLTTQIQDPRSNDPESIMPSYNNLSKEKVSDLVDYLMTLSKKDSSQDKKLATMQKTAMNTGKTRGDENVSLSMAGEKWSDICGRCHNLRPPSEYSDAQWTAAVDQMRLLVPLTGQEHRDILEFLKANN